MDIMEIFNSYVTLYKASKDTQYAIKITEMICNKEVGITEKPKYKSGNLMFSKKTLFKTKCCKCKKFYDKGTPCFYKYTEDNKSIGWHVECATEEDKLNDQYIKWSNTEDGISYLNKESQIQ